MVEEKFKREEKLAKLEEKLQDLEFEQMNLEIDLENVEKEYRVFREAMIQNVLEAYLKMKKAKSKEEIISIADQLIDTILYQNLSLSELDNDRKNLNYKLNKIENQIKKIKKKIWKLK